MTSTILKQVIALTLSGALLLGAGMAPAATGHKVFATPEVAMTS